MPGINFCFFHQKSLMEVTVLFRDRQSHFLFPTNLRVKSSSLRSPQHLLSKGFIRKEAFIYELTYSLNLSDEFLYANKQELDKHLTIMERTKLSNTLTPISLNPLITNLLILWLFQNWDCFLSSYRWQYVMHSSKTDNHLMLNLNNSFGSKTIHRAICIDFLEKSVNSSRTDFWIAHPKSCRWLIKYDTNWFNSKLPKLKTMLTYKQMDLY